MPDPLRIEQEFRRLQHLLAHPGSPRSKLLALARFVEPAPEGPDALEPYLPELAQRVVQITGDAAAARGCDPRLLRNLVRALRAPEAAAVLGSVAGLPAALGGIELQADLASAWAGELAVPSGRTPAGATPLERLEAAMAEDPSSDRLRRLREAWENALRVEPLETLVPVVDRSAGAGALRTVRLTIVGTRPRGGDEVHVDAAVYGVHQPGEELLARPLAAARALAAGWSAFPAGLVATLVFEGAHLLHEGRSAELALAALLALGYRRARGEREEVALRPDCCLTGAIDAQGNVLGVDEAGLGEKLQAVFFSPAAVFVVPRAQVGLVERHLAALTAEYPHRMLAILGVGHLRELFFDRRITDLRPVPWVRHAVRRTWQWRRPLATGVLMVLLIIIARLWYGPLDKEPASFSFAGTSLVVENRSGQKVAVIPANAVTVQEATSPGPLGGGVHMAAIADVNHDNRKEVIWLQFDNAHPNSATRVECRTVGEETFLWSFDLTRAMDFPHSDDVVGSELRSNYLQVDDCDRDGNMEVYVLARHISFPGILYQLDARTGQRMGEYVNTGHIGALRTVDLNDDGIREVVVVGLNDALRRGFLAVFDPRSISGCSPTTEEYRMEGYTPGTELQYLLLHRSVVGEAFALQSRSNIPYGIVLDTTAARLSIWIRDANITSVGNCDSITATLILHFDYGMRLQGVSSGDDYDMVYDVLRSRGEIPDRPRAAYLKEYLSHLR